MQVSRNGSVAHELAHDLMRLPRGFESDLVQFSDIDIDQLQGSLVHLEQETAAGAAGVIGIDPGIGDMNGLAAGLGILLGPGISLTISSGFSSPPSGSSSGLKTFFGGGDDSFLRRGMVLSHLFHVRCYAALLPLPRLYMRGADVTQIPIRGTSAQRT